MKKALLLILITLCFAGSVWSGEFEDNLIKAEQGNAEAQLNLGLMFKNGKGVTQDHKQAFYWCKKAAEQDDANAQLNLGSMYLIGEGVAQDVKQALYWYKKAVEQGAEAQELMTMIQYQIDHPTESKEQQSSISKTEKKITGAEPDSNR